LDFKKVIVTGIDPDSENHFEILNIDYKPEEISKKRKETTEPMSFLESGYVKLPTDSEAGKVDVEFLDIKTNRTRNRTLSYTSKTYSIKSVAQAMFDRFSDLPTDEKKTYYENLWTIEKLEEMIKTSLKKSSNDAITRKIRNAFLNSMNVLFRDYTNFVSYESLPTKFEMISTKTLSTTTTELSTLRKNKAIFYSDKFEKADLDDASKISLEEIQDTTNSYKHKKVDNVYFFKTPQLAIVTTGDPEMNFVKKLIGENVAKSIDSFIKSTDSSFYKFDYTWKKGTHQQYSHFNPDFFIKKGNMIIVVEIKDDAQITDPESENVGKYKVTVTIRDGRANYAKSSKYTTFRINPKGTSISSLTKAKKGFTVKWKKQSGKMAKTRITGYQYRYSTSSKMTNANIKTVKGYSKTSAKRTSLKANKKYYVQVRTYKVVNKTWYYSPWSKAKAVTTK